MRWKIKALSDCQVDWPPLRSAAFLCPTKLRDMPGDDTRRYHVDTSSSTCLRMIVFQHILDCNVNLLTEGASPFVLAIPVQNQFKLFSVENLIMYFLQHFLLKISSLEDHQQNTFSDNLLTARYNACLGSSSCQTQWLTEQDNKFQAYLILLISVNEITAGAVPNYQLPSNTWWERWRWYA